ncbi:hypothetical protein [Caballeronia sp.]|uniref:hypothetical protein n=1 Tax=Caballeronia sp. TaxID=1931223 RepID=UPI003C5F3117
MGFFYTPLPLWLAVGGWIVTAAVLALALWKNPFRRIQDGTLQHVWFGIVVAVTVLWACNTWFEEGPAIHLLGATLIVTLFDWQLALVAMAATTGLAAVVLDASWPGVPVTFVLFGALPVAVSAVLQKAIHAWIPRSLFVFILGQGFLTSACSVAVACCAGLLLQIALAGTELVIPTGFTLAASLLVAGEAVFTGVFTILISVYRPAWITTFDVRRYRLDRGPRV